VQKSFESRKRVVDAGLADTTGAAPLAALVL
jgi:hypothetical protein